MKKCDNVEIEIRDDMPIPKHKPGREYRFPFDKLEVGQCFIVHGMHKNILSPYRIYAEKHLGRKFTTKTTDDGIAVWRTM